MFSPQVAVPSSPLSVNLPRWAVRVARARAGRRGRTRAGQRPRVRFAETLVEAGQRAARDRRGPPSPCAAAGADYQLRPAAPCPALMARFKVEGLMARSIHVCALRALGLRAPRAARASSSRTEASRWTELGHAPRLSQVATQLRGDSWWSPSGRRSRSAPDRNKLTRRRNLTDRERAARPSTSLRSVPSVEVDGTNKREALRGKPRTWWCRSNGRSSPLKGEQLGKLPRPSLPASAVKNVRGGRTNPSAEETIPKVRPASFNIVLKPGGPRSG